MDYPAVELSHLRMFLVLAEELHFGRAAARLNMAQPPLTRQIKLLEQRLHCRLFERTSRSTLLTPAGAQLVERAGAIVADAEQTFQTLQRMGRGEEGQVHLATAPSLMLGSLPHLIRAFRKKYPGVDFRLSEMASSSILQAVHTGAADLGLIRGMDRDAEIETHLRWKEPMVAILPLTYPAAPGVGMPVAQLRSEPFVFFPRRLGPSFYDEVIGHCRQAGFVPEVTQEARQWSSIIGLVSAGMGVSIGPQSVASLSPKAVRCVPLRGFQTTVRLVGRRRDSNAAVSNFVEMARKEARLEKTPSTG